VAKPACNPAEIAAAPVAVAASLCAADASLNLSPKDTISATPEAAVTSAAAEATVIEATAVARNNSWLDVAAAAGEEAAEASADVIDDWECVDSPGPLPQP
jgi:hypothetical protein